MIENKDQEIKALKKIVNDAKIMQFDGIDPSDWLSDSSGEVNDREENQEEDSESQDSSDSTKIFYCEICADALESLDDTKQMIINGDGEPYLEVIADAKNNSIALIYFEYHQG
jgi:hypothetical protein